MDTSLGDAIIAADKDTLSFTYEFINTIKNNKKANYNYFKVLHKDINLLFAGIVMPDGQITKEEMYCECRLRWAVIELDKYFKNKRRNRIIILIISVIVVWTICCAIFIKYLF